MPEIIEDFFVYTTGKIAALTAGTSTTVNIAIQADSNFKIQKMTYNADIAAAGQTDSSRVIPLVSVLMVDTGSGRQLMNAALPLAAICGEGDSPFILPTPKILAARSTLALTFTNFDAANTYNLYFHLIGVKQYRMS